MKRQLGVDVTGNYTFVPASNTITFSNVPYTLSANNILLITNVTANTIIYNFADPSTGAVSFTNNVLTLDYNTSAMSANDTLQIYFDLESNEESLLTLLRRMNILLESNAVVDSSQRQRVAVETMPSTAVTGTVGITNASGLGPTNTVNAASNPYNTSSLQVQNIFEGPVDQRWRIIDAARAAYGSAIRANLIY